MLGGRGDKESRMRILIAEDDRVLADGLLRSLRNAGYAADQVSDGAQADAALATHAFDLLILDLGLPRLHGLDVLRKLRARGSARASPFVTSRWSPPARSVSTSPSASAACRAAGWSRSTAPNRRARPR